MSTPVRLSKHFTLAEMTKSQTALRRGIKNTPSEGHTSCLRAVCENILEPVREHYGVPIAPSSGYRSPALCEAIGSSKNSQHAKGQAVDFEVPGVANVELARWLIDNVEFDQLILEYYDPNDPAAGWVHCSYNPIHNRRQALVYDGKSYQPFNL